MLAIARYLACNPRNIVGQRIEHVLWRNKACLNFNNGRASPFSAYTSQIKMSVSCFLHVNFIAIADQVLGA